MIGKTKLSIFHFHIFIFISNLKLTNFQLRQIFVILCQKLKKDRFFSLGFLTTFGDFDIFLRQLSHKQKNWLEPKIQVNPPKIFNHYPLSIVRLFRNSSYFTGTILNLPSVPNPATFMIGWKIKNQTKIKNKSSHCFSEQIRLLLGPFFWPGASISNFRLKCEEKLCDI